jgi:hypothetical protein
MEPFKVEQYLIPEIEVWPKNRDNKHCFLLDGYDWTTIDHDPLQEFEISPGEEQKAGWYNSDDNTKGRLPLKFVHQHFQIQAIADPLSQGDLGVNRFVGKGAKVHAWPPVSSSGCSGIRQDLRQGGKNDQDARLLDQHFDGTKEVVGDRNG